MTVKDERYTRTKHLCGVLSKLLERAPSTYADETPSGEWIDAVEKVGTELSMELGKGKGAGAGVNAALSAFAELQKYDEELNSFINEHAPGNVGKLSWVVLFNWAKQQVKLMLDIRQAAGVLVTQRDEEIRTLTTENELIKAELTRMIEERDRAPRRFKRVG